MTSTERLIERVETELSDWPTTEETARVLGAGFPKSRIEAGLRAKAFPFGDAFMGRGTSYTYHICKARLIAWLKGDDIGRDRQIAIITPDGMLPSQTVLKRLLKGD